MSATPPNVLRGEPASRLAAVGPETVVVEREKLRSFREQAELEGYRAGYEAGTAAAADDAREAAAAARADLESALAALVRATDLARDTLERERRRLEEAACDLAFGVAEAVLAREISLREDPGRDALTRALAELPTDGHATVHLHPDDAVTLDRAGVPPGVTVVPDPSIGRGGCVLELGPATLDARVESALERVRRVLDDARSCR